jgi:prepilin-type processing-associated H-X9-DG protein
LLVCLGIGALLISLLLAAVQQARVAAARVACQSNLRQIALAVHAYSDTHQHLPIGCDYRSNVSFPPPHAFSPGISWHTSILPWVEQEALWRLAEQAHRDDPYGLSAEHAALQVKVVPAYLCPSETRKLDGYGERNVWALTSYLGVAGTGRREENGLFHPYLAVRMSEITDGTSTTLLLGERPPGPNGMFSSWYAAWGDCVCVLTQILSTDESTWLPGPPGTRHCPQEYSPLRPGRIDEPCDLTHFWSLHGGGANFAFADGSVRWISDRSANLLPLLSTRAGGEVVPADF